MLCADPQRLSVLAFLLFSIAVFYFILVVLPSGGDSLEQDVCDTGCRAVDSLRLVTVVSRHGNRGCPLDYPKDPYPSGNRKYWPYNPDELTPYGRVQMYNLGVKLRSMYSGFLPDLYYAEDLRASSTSMDRLLMSGEAFLAGLYPPRDFQVWNPDLNWQPIPLYSDSLDKTKIIFKCPKYVEEAVKTVLSNFKVNSGPLRTVSEHITEATGANMAGNIVGVFAMWDKLSSEKTEGLQTPEWTNNILLPLQELATRQYKTAFGGTDTLARLLIGEEFEQMLGAMTEKVRGSLTPDRKMFYFSGHDSSIIALQRILGIPMDSVVGMVRPASALIIELHQDNTSKQYFLQIIYIDGGEPDRVKLLQLPDNSFDALVRTSRTFTHVNYTEECLDTTFSLPESTQDFPADLFGGSFFYRI